MPRVYVLSKVPAALYNTCSGKLCDIYGDEPGTDEFSGLNYSADGSAPGTYAVCSAGGLTLAQASEWQTFLAGQTDCGSAQYADVPAGGFDADILSLWGLRPVV